MKQLSSADVVSMQAMLQKLDLQVCLLCDLPSKPTFASLLHGCPPSYNDNEPIQDTAYKSMPSAHYRSVLM